MDEVKITVANKGFCNIGADGITMSNCNSILHLFGQTIFNLAFCSYLIISFSIRLRFRADVFQIPHLRQALYVMCHPIEHPAHIQSSMTLPTRPHAIFSTWQGTQNPDTKPTLQRAKIANAQPTHPG